MPLPTNFLPDSASKDSLLWFSSVPEPTPKYVTMFGFQKNEICLLYFEMMIVVFLIFFSRAHLFLQTVYKGDRTVEAFSKFIQENRVSSAPAG